MWALWPWSIRAAALLLGLLLVWYPLPDPPGPRPGARARGGGGGAADRWVPPGLALVFLAGCLFFPARTLLFGDGIEIANRVAGGLAIAPRSPLFSFLLRLLCPERPAAELPDVYRVVRLISTLGGVLYALLLAWIWRTRLGRAGPAAAGVLVGGYLCLFQGYIEAYAIFVLVQASFLVTLLSTPSPRRNIRLVLAQVLLVVSHVLGWLFLPVTLWTLLRHEPGRRRRMVVILTAGSLALLGLLAIRHRLSPQLGILDPRVAFRYLEDKAAILRQPALWTSPLGFLRWERFPDILNGMFLAIGPALLTAAGLLFHAAGRRALRSAIVTPVGAAAGIMLAVRLVVSSGLGPFLDWDLYACFYTPTLFVVGLALAGDRLQSFRRAASMPILATAVILTAPVAAMLHSPARAAQRLQSYLHGLPPPSPSQQAHAEHRLGDQFARRGDHIAAAQAFARAFDRDPRAVYARRAGAAWQSAGELENAISEFSRALTLNPRDIVSLQQRGALLLHVHRTEEAARDFAVALVLDPERCLTLLDSGIAESELGNQAAARFRFERAIDCYRQGLATGRNPFADRAFLARALMRRGRYAEAILEWRTILDDDMFRTRAWYNLAESCLQAARPLQAVEALIRLHDLVPGSALVLARLGDAYLSAHQLDAAIGAYQSSLQLMENLEVRHRLAAAGGLRSSPGGATSGQPASAAFDSLLARAAESAWRTGDDPPLPEEPPPRIPVDDGPGADAEAAAPR